MAFQYVLAKCPLSGEYTASDWWFVLNRHHTYIESEEALSRISKEKKLVAKYMIFHLQGYKAGESFNIKTIHDKDQK